MRTALIPTKKYNYLLYENGDIFNITRNKQVFGWIQNIGYRAVDLAHKKFTVHRLLGIFFIPNPDNLPEINHKDGNKLNNSLDNLEWVTGLTNVRHAYTTGLCKRNALIDYTLLPSILEKFYNGTPLHELTTELGLVGDSSSLRKLLKRDAIHTGNLDKFNAACNKNNKKHVIKQSHKVHQLDLQNNLVKIHDSINAAGRYMGNSPATIYKAIVKNKLYKNFYWVKDVTANKNNNN